MRQILPQRRACETFDFEHDGSCYTATLGRHETGTIGEVFLNGRRHNNAVMRDAAIAVSLALQYGTPLETLRKAMTRNGDGAASSPIGKLLDLLGDVSLDLPRTRGSL